MRPASLFCLCLLSKLLAFSQGLDWTNPWFWVALTWQDAAVCLVYAAIDLALHRRHKLNWSLYAVLAIYISLNVPLVRATSSPLTAPMLNATGAALSDSIMHFVTLTNISILMLLFTAAWSLPKLWQPIGRRTGRGLAILALGIVAFGPSASKKSETAGLDRNFFVALASSSVPRSPAQSAQSDWRQSPYPEVDPSSAELLLNEFDQPVSGTARHHNVVLVILESAAAEYLKCYGAEQDPMPRLTRWAERSVVCENAYTVYPESIKGLVAVLSSRWPALDTQAEDYESFGRHSLAHVLAENGYRTGLFHSGRFGYLGMQSVIQDRGFDTLEGAAAISGETESSFGVDERSTVARILGWIDETTEAETAQPFFVTYMPIAGHHPYDTPEPGPFADDQEIGRYRNALHYADQALGQLLDGLDQRQLDANTLIVIVGDHGQAFGQHPNNWGHTFFLYEENIRVPLLLSWPEAEPGLRINRPVSVISVAPTILDLVGVDVPTEFAGRSLFCRESELVLFFTDYSLALLGLRDGRWKLITQLESGRSQLYDLQQDPGEQFNIADQYPERVAGYEQHLRRWAAAQRALVLRQ